MRVPDWLALDLPVVIWSVNPVTIGQTDIDATATSGRLYQELALTLIADIAAGRFPVGTRLPAERELALRHGVAIARYGEHRLTRARPLADREQETYALGVELVSRDALAL